MNAVPAKENRRFLFFGSLTILCIAAAVYTEQKWLAFLPLAPLVLYSGWINFASLFFLLLVSLAFSTEFHFSDELGTDIPDEFLMLLVAFLFVAITIYDPSKFKKRWASHPITWLLTALILWTIVTVITSTHPLTSFKFLLAKSWYILAFCGGGLLVFTDQKNISRAAILMVGSISVAVLIVLLRHASSGFRFATINEAVVPFFRNHVNYSAMLVCSIPITCACAWLAKNKLYRNLFILAIALQLTALFFSYSRGAWLALLAGGLAVWLTRRKWLVGFYMLALLAVTLSLFYIKSNDRYLALAPQFRTTIFHKDFGEHLVATYKLKDVSTAERFYRWAAGIRMIKDKWLTGYGPNSFYEEYKPYGIPAFKTWVSNNEDHSTVHNYFLLTAIEQGIPGLLLLCLLLGTMLWSAQRIYSRSQDPYQRVLGMTTAPMIIMFIVLNFLSDLIETDKVGSLFFLVLAVIISTSPRIQKA
jgi:O-antigen ligase